jgi:hypothetical protein
MRWRTFERLHEKITECEQKKDDALYSFMTRMGWIE